MTDEYFNEMISDLKEAIRSIKKDLKTIEEIGDVMLLERNKNVSDGPLLIKKKNKDVYKTLAERTLEFAKFCTAQSSRGSCSKCAANKEGAICMDAWLALEVDPEVSQDG